jgi:hypothetical protein
MRVFTPSRSARLMNVSIHLVRLVPQVSKTLARPKWRTLRARQPGGLNLAKVTVSRKARAHSAKGDSSPRLFRLYRGKGANRAGGCGGFQRALLLL